MDITPIDFDAVEEPPVPGQHHADAPINRLDINELLKEAGVTKVEPVWWTFEDGTRQLVAIAMHGEGEVVAEALDLNVATETSPRIQQRVHEAVMARVTELITIGFRQGLEFAHTGVLPETKVAG